MGLLHTRSCEYENREVIYCTLCLGACHAGVSSLHKLWLPDALCNDKKSDNERIAVNARMVGADLIASIPVRDFDGADSWKYLNE